MENASRVDRKLLQVAMDAAAETRRLTALTLAVEYNESPVNVLDTAVRFEAYLRGDQPVVGVEASEYALLLKRSNELLRLERNGVDGWEGYSRG